MSAKGFLMEVKRSSSQSSQGTSSPVHPWRTKASLSLGVMFWRLAIVSVLIFTTVTLTEPTSTHGELYKSQFHNAQLPEKRLHQLIPFPGGPYSFRERCPGHSPCRLGFVVHAHTRAQIRTETIVSTELHKCRLYNRRLQGDRCFVQRLYHDVQD